MGGRTAAVKVQRVVHSKIADHIVGGIADRHSITPAGVVDREEHQRLVVPREADARTGVPLVVPGIGIRVAAGGSKRPAAGRVGRDRHCSVGDDLGAAANGVVQRYRLQDMFVVRLAAVPVHDAGIVVGSQ